MPGDTHPGFAENVSCDALNLWVFICYEYAVPNHVSLVTDACGSADPHRACVLMALNCLIMIFMDELEASKQVRWGYKTSMRLLPPPAFCPAYSRRPRFVSLCSIDLLSMAETGGSRWGLRPGSPFLGVALQ